MITYLTSWSLSDAQIQQISGHESKKSLEVYQHLSLESVDKGESMKSVLNDFANDTDADLAAYVQMYRSRIADRTDEIKDKVAGPGMR
jgi:hypothetical protein